MSWSNFLLSNTGWANINTGLASLRPGSGQPRSAYRTRSRLKKLGFTPFALDPQRLASASNLRRRQKGTWSHSATHTKDLQQCYWTLLKYLHTCIPCRLIQCCGKVIHKSLLRLLENRPTNSPHSTSSIRYSLFLLKKPISNQVP